MATGVEWLYRIEFFAILTECQNDHETVEKVI